jgi:integrase
MAKKDHGGWYARFGAPPGADGKRRQPRVGPFRTRKEAELAVAEAIGDIAAGKDHSDRKTTLGQWLPRWLGWHEHEIKPRTVESYREIFDRYWIPALGHVRVADLREPHIRDVQAALRKINTPAEAEDRSELMRRLGAVRATARHLPGVRLSRRPLSEQTIARITAPLRTALGARGAKLAVNPAAGTAAAPAMPRPLVWTAARVEQWRLDGKRPAPVMVWTREQTGAFLDAVAGDRWYALWHLAVMTGMRRGELARLSWADTDLDRRRVHVRGDVKSAHSDRQVPVGAGTVAALRAHRKAQAAARLASAGLWADSGRVFTREDGSPLRDGAISERFALLLAQAALPPVRFHDLRHGTASMMVAAGQPIKVISEMLGHATAAFTQHVYVSVGEELAEQAADALAAFIPRKTLPGAAE